MLGIFGILAAARRLLGVIFSIKNNAPSLMTPVGNFEGSQNTLQQGAWNHIALNVADSVATIYVNGQTVGGTLGAPEAITYPSPASLQNVGYLKNTVVNINGNSFLNGNNKTFIDRSPLNSTITTTSGGLVASGVTLGSVSPYSNMEWSGLFTGTNHLSVSVDNDEQFAFGKDDFTIECWFNVNAFTASVNTPLLECRDGVNTSHLFLYIDPSKKIAFYVNGTNYNKITGNVAVTTNRWYHVALVKTARLTSLYLDGKLIGSTTYNGYVYESTTAFTIGRQYDQAYYFNGYISNMRVVRGVALYNDEFTPPNQALSLIPQSENKSWSGYFNGVNYLSSGNFSERLEYSDFAIDFWIYAIGVPIAGTLLDMKNGAVEELLFSLNADMTIDVTQKSTVILSTDRFSNDSWNHIRLVRINNGFYLYVNGILNDTYTSKIFNYSIPSLTIGANYQAGAILKNVYLSNLRIIKGSSVNNNTVNIPTSNLELVGLSANDYVAASNIVGAANYALSARSNNLSLGNNNFTYETWINFNNPAINGGTGIQQPFIFDTRTSNTDTVNPILNLSPDTGNATASLIYGQGTSTGALAIKITSSVKLLSGIWYHVAVSRNKATGTTLYVNGENVGFWDDTANTYNSPNLVVGMNAYVVNSGLLKGYLTDFRVSSAALYSGSSFEVTKTKLLSTNDTLLLTLQGPTYADYSGKNTPLLSGGGVMVANNWRANILSGGSIAVRSNILPRNAFLDAGVMAKGDEDFTLEFFEYTYELPAAACLLQINATYNGPGRNDIYIQKTTDTTIVLTYVAGNRLICTGYMGMNKWNHIALTRKDTYFNLFINGKKQSGEAYPFYGVNKILNGLYIGSTETNTSPHNGLISNLRIVRGSALYTDDFTPPTQNLSLIPPVGEFGYSGRFTGSSFLSCGNIPTDALNFGTSNFTVECWVNFGNIGTNNINIFRWSNAGNNPMCTLYYENLTKYIKFAAGNNVELINSAFTPNICTWYHIAVVFRTGVGTFLYINGTQYGTTATTVTNWGNYTHLNIGYANITNPSTQALSGNIADFRITKSAVYTSNFTPPTALLTPLPNTTLLTLQNETLVDNAGFFTGANSLEARGDFYISKSNPLIYPESHTSLLTFNGSTTDQSVYNSKFTAANVFKNPVSHAESTICLALNKNTPLSGDASGHLQIRTIGSFSMSAVDPFGSNGYSAVFNGTNTGLSAIYNGPAYLDDDEFTIEFWMYSLSAHATNKILFSTLPHGTASTGNGGIQLYLNASSNQLIYRRPADSGATISGPYIELYKWYHISLTRNNNKKVQLYVNGALIDTYVDLSTQLFNQRNISIGSRFVGTAQGEFFYGLISNLRIIKGNARYNLLDSKNFDVPTDALSINDTPAASFSYYFNGSTNYLRSYSPQFNFGNKNFTIEMWINFSSSVLMYLLHTSTAWATTNFGLLLSKDANNKITLSYAGSLKFTYDYPLTPGNWYHLALVRNTSVGSTLFVNGKSVGTFDDKNIIYIGDRVNIGAVEFGADNKFNGLISNLRITKNQALYSSNFTPSNVPLQATLPSDHYATKFFGSNAFYSTSAALASIYTKDTPAFNFGANPFCIEFYALFSNIGRGVYIFDSRYINPSENLINIRRNAANKIQVYTGNTLRITSTTTLSSINTWYHIAYDRKPTGGSLYINGVSAGGFNDSGINYGQISYMGVGTATVSSATPTATTSVLQFSAFDGFISNFRISNVSRYSGSNATIPDNKFVSDSNTLLLAFTEKTFSDKGPYIFPISYFNSSVNTYYYSTNALGSYSTINDNTPRVILFTGDSAYAQNYIEEINATKVDANPFNSPIKNIFSGFSQKNDIISLANGKTIDYSPKNPFSTKYVITSLLAFNDSRFKNDAPYINSILNTTTSNISFNTYSPFLNITPYTSAYGGSIYFSSLANKFLLVNTNRNVTNFGTSDFTIEFWAYKNSTSTAQMVLFDTASGALATTPGHMRIYIDAAHKIVFYVDDAIVATTTNPIQLNAWNHISVVRDNSVLKIYINGTLAATPVNNNTNYIDYNRIALGSLLSSINTNTFTGYITDVRVVSGSALYKSNFTPPVAPLSSNEQGMSLNTRLLINANNVGIADSTGKVNLFSDGNVNISNDVPPITSSATTGNLTAGSIYFDGSNNTYVYTDAASPFFAFSTYTAEFWVKPTVVPTTSAVILSIRNTDADKFVLALNNTRNLVYKVGTAGATFTSNTTIPLNDWTHVALVGTLSASTTYKNTLYINGVSAGSVGAVPTTTNKILNIGSDNNTFRLSGYIDDFRIIKDEARYLNDFIKPTREGEIHNNLVSPNDPFLSKTKLLINADTNTGVSNNQLADESNNQLIVQSSGKVYQGSVSPFSPGFGYNPQKHGGSIYLDGASHVDVIDLNNKKPFNFSQNYTIEAWVYPLNNSSLPTIFDTRLKGVSAKIGSAYNDTSNFIGYIAGVRTLKGVSLYGGDFVSSLIPAAPDSNTSLLLNFRKAGIIDSLSKNNIITQGDVSVSFDTKKYGVGSVFFEGGYLEMPSATHFALGTEDFTFDFNINFSNLSQNFGIFSTTDPSTTTAGHVYLAYKNNKLCMGVYGSNEIVFSNWSPAINTWYSIAVVRKDGICTLYVDGTSKNAITFNNDITLQNGFCIGKTSHGAFLGYIDEFRFTKGQARYDGNYVAEQSMSLLYDAEGSAYNTNTTAIIFDPPRYPSNNGPFVMDYAILGGGGCGGSVGSTLNIFGGGGGAGGLKEGSLEINLPSRMTIAIGAGGGGGNTNVALVSPGSNTILNINDTSFVAYGGGAGASNINNVFYPAGNGGCGGGALNTLSNNYNGNVPGSSLDNQGFPGGSILFYTLSSRLYSPCGGGGGGIGGPAVFPAPYHATLVASYIGGAGKRISIIPSNFPNVTAYDVGGGGGGGIVPAGGASSGWPSYMNNNKWGAGDQQSSGNPFTRSRGQASNPTRINSGAGGAGAANLTWSGAYDQAPGVGASGLCVLRFPIAANKYISTTGTVSRVVFGDYVYFTFTSTGTLTIL
jgi:hypothetical protein